MCVALRRLAQAPFPCARYCSCSERKRINREGKQRGCETDGGTMTAQSCKRTESGRSSLLIRWQLTNLFHCLISEFSNVSELPASRVLLCSLWPVPPTPTTQLFQRLRPLLSTLLPHSVAIFVIISFTILSIGPLLSPPPLLSLYRCLSVTCAV